MIPRLRRVPIETDSSALVEARIGENGACRQVWGSTIPPSWQRGAETLRQTRGVVVVLGDVDSGKSTLCTYLANTCVQSGIQVRVIDGDIGQADIGPPTTISSATVSKNIFNLHELGPKRSYFIGDTSPSSVPGKHIQSIVNLKQETSSTDQITIVNTDGWTKEERAVEHKHDLLKSVQPDLVLGLCNDHELDPILQPQQAPTIRLDASKFAKTRTREERKKTREEGYRRFLQNHQTLDFKLNRIKLKMFNQPQQQRFDLSSTHRGTIAGLLDDEGILLSIARIVEIRNGILHITTNLHESPATIELGAVVLSSRFEEVGFES